MPEIRFDHVGKTFPSGVVALQDVCLTIASGECLVLVGPSGCGKTTALRLLAGLETPTRGALYRDGQPLADVPPWQRGVAMAFQSPALLPHQTVERQWEFTVKQRKKRQATPPAPPLSKGGMRGGPDIPALAKLLSLQDRLGATPPQLSGGEIQRVVLGKIILSGASLWLLDEPLAHLDFPLRRKFLSDLHLLRSRFPATICYVTHDPGEARAVGDRIAVLHKGFLQQVDQPDAVVSRPANPWVAELFQVNHDERDQANMVR